jgi:acyl-CoA hydrolase
MQLHHIGSSLHCRERNMADRQNESMGEWRDSNLESLSPDERMKRILEIAATRYAQWRDQAKAKRKEELEKLDDEQRKLLLLRRAKFSEL